MFRSFKYSELQETQFCCVAIFCQEWFCVHLGLPKQSTEYVERWGSRHEGLFRLTRWKQPLPLVFGFLLLIANLNEQGQQDESRRPGTLWIRLGDGGYFTRSHYHLAWRWTCWRRRSSNYYWGILTEMDMFWLATAIETHEYCLCEMMVVVSEGYGQWAALILWCTEKRWLHYIDLL